MDSLHVTSQPTTGSKTSSRSASPCRLKTDHQPTGGYHPHHMKTLSHGSVDSSKSHDGVNLTHKSVRHRSPTSTTNRPLPETTPTSPLAGMDDSTAGTVSGLDESLRQDHDISDFYNTSSFVSNGSTEHVKEDDTDCLLDAKTNAVLEHLGNKIVRVRDLIRTEQKLRDDNVNEYLKLASNAADKQQIQRIKAVFEKKNQKSAQAIAQLQKKLDSYQKRVNELETHGVQGHRMPREVLRDMGQGLKNVGGNIRDGITGFSGSVMSKPREFAHLIKNKFGSADNISQLSRSGVAGGSEGSGVPPNGGSDQGDPKTGSGHGQHSAAHHSAHRGHQHHGSATLPATLSQTSMGGAQSSGANPRNKFPSEEESECSSVTSDSIGRYGRSQDANNCQHEPIIELTKKIRILQEKLDGCQEGMETNKALQAEIQFLNLAIQDERFRTERLEEQINDLTELHQNEVENLKQAMADMEEKVQYQSEERLRDIHEMLEHCQTKIQKMEHQALQQQQYVMLEGLDNSNARALVVKLINVLLTVLQVVLLLVATGAGIIMPFLRTRVRIITTVVFVVTVVFTLKQWPEVQDLGSHAVKRIKGMLGPVH